MPTTTTVIEVWDDNMALPLFLHIEHNEDENPVMIADAWASTQRQEMGPARLLEPNEVVGGYFSHGERTLTRKLRFGS